MTGFVTTPNQDVVQTALRSVLVAVLGDQVDDVIVAVENRVPEPRLKNFVVMAPLRFQRLATNVDSAADVRFLGSISGTTMTVSSVTFGTILPGAVVFGTGVAPNTSIVAQLTGPAGGVGTYSVSVSQNVAPPVLAAGGKAMSQSAEVVVQLDFHSADNRSSALAQTVATVMRDPVGAQMFEDLGLGVAPLYADDPRYVPFVNAEQQYEWRWVLEAHLQVHQVTLAPLQYADAIAVELLDVDAVYPP